MPLRTLLQNPGASKDAGSVSSESLKTVKSRTHRKLYIQRRHDKITLVCHWRKCRFVSSSVEEFNKHVATHIPGPDAVIDPSSHDWRSVSRCRWEHCSHVSATVGELRRHVLYHAFHIKLLALGSNLVTRTKVSPCQLSTVERHLVPPVPEPFRCLWDGCGVLFDEPQTFFSHVEYHIHCQYYQTGAKVFRCLWEDCTVVLCREYTVAGHVRSHTQEKMCACPKCGNTFTSNQKLFDHCQRQAPPQEQRFQCSHCLKFYASERLLRSHIRSHINTYRCEMCGMTCINPATLRLHIKFRHSDVKDFPCDQCDKRFKKKYDMTRHRDRHRADRRQFCPVIGCEYSSLEPTTLRRHCRIKHGNERPARYACHLCDKTCLRAPTMTRHLKLKHHLALPEGHMRFSYKRDPDGYLRLQMLRYESLDVAQQMGLGSEADADAEAAAAEPDVLALTCSDDDVPDSIQTDEGRELTLPEVVREALATGARVLVTVHNDQVQLLAHTAQPLGATAQRLEDPDDPGALMLVLDESSQQQ